MNAAPATPTARYLPDVIVAMLAEVPPDEIVLRHDLNSTREKALSAPPEYQPSWWRRLIVVLSEDLPAPTKDWHWRVLSIFAGKPVGPAQAVSSGQG